MAGKKVKLKYNGISGPNNEQHNEVREYSEEEADYLLATFPGQFEKVKGSEKKPSNDSSKDSSDGSAVDKRSDKKAKTQNKK